MDVYAYLRNNVVEATTPPGETATAAQLRREAIEELFKAYAPANAMQALIVSNCVSIQFLLNAAIRDASNTNLEPALQRKLSASAMSITRALAQWHRQLEKLQHPAKARVAAAKQVAPTPEQPAMPAPQLRSPAAPMPQPPMPPDNQAPHLLGLNGRSAAPVIMSPDAILATILESLVPPASG
ncbi:MAG: hypothetical protein EXR07_03995 [Acetobacteraceae bacterium]|nr:hypothetical protein [Acetobacteraceae bacterium]